MNTTATETIFGDDIVHGFLGTCLLVEQPRLLTPSTKPSYTSSMSSDTADTMESSEMNHP